MSGCSERQSTVVAVEELHSDLALELLELSGQRRLGDMERLGGAAHRAEFGDRAEGREQAQVHVAIVCHYGMKSGAKWHWTTCDARATMGE